MIKNKIERYGRKGDREAVLSEMPILGQRSITQPLNNFFVQHMSEHLQVTYVIEGVIDFTLDGCIYTVKKGDIIINRPGQVFGTLNETFPHSKSAFFKVNLGSQSGWERGEIALIRSQLDNLVFPHLTPESGFYKTFQLILNEHRKSSPFSRLRCRSSFQQLLLMILHAHEEQMKSANTGNLAIGDMFSQVNQYVSDNLGKKIYARQMAEVSGLSESHFRYLFSMIYKTTPLEYVLRRRIERAKELLRTSQSITSIAFDLAFSSSQYLSNTFKKLTGMSPREYRRALKALTADSRNIFSDQESSEFMDAYFE